MSNPGAVRRKGKVVVVCRSVLGAEQLLEARDNDVRAYGEGSKQLRHPVAGLIAMALISRSSDRRLERRLHISLPAIAGGIASV